MEKFKLIEKIKSLYEEGGNIIQYLKSEDNRSFNTIEDILISYDFQSGSYIKEYYNNKEFKDQYSSAIAHVINKLGKFDSIIEAGVGEATTLGVMLKSLDQQPKHALGFDLSWSRIYYADNFVREQGFKSATLFTSDLFETPLKDNSIDVVYTSHALEPNGGKEKEALTELYRIAKKYVVLLEPCYEFASEEAKARMIKHGYVTKLLDTAKLLGYKVLEHRLFGISSNPLNPTGLLIIEKNGDSHDDDHAQLVCPISKTALTNFDNNVLYSRESLLAYPIIKGIPCLLKQNAVLAAHFMMDYKTFRNND